MTKVISPQTAVRSSRHCTAPSLSPASRDRVPVPPSVQRLFRALLPDDDERHSRPANRLCNRELEPDPESGNEPHRTGHLFYGLLAINTATRTQTQATSGSPTFELDS